MVGHPLVIGPILPCTCRDAVNRQLARSDVGTSDADKIVQLRMRLISNSSAGTAHASAGVKVIPSHPRRSPVYHLGSKPLIFLALAGRECSLGEI